MLESHRRRRQRWFFICPCSSFTLYSIECCVRYCASPCHAIEVFDNKNTEREDSGRWSQSERMRERMKTVGGGRWIAKDDGAETRRALAFVVMWVFHCNCDLHLARVFWPRHYLCRAIQCVLPNNWANTRILLHKVATRPLLHRHTHPFGFIFIPLILCARSYLFTGAIQTECLTSWMNECYSTMRCWEIHKLRDENKTKPKKISSVYDETMQSYERGYMNFAIIQTTHQNHRFIFPLFAPFVCCFSFLLSRVHNDFVSLLHTRALMVLMDFILERSSSHTHTHKQNK